MSIQWKGFAHTPIKFYNNGWFFWDETWSNAYGPFHSHIEAAAQLLDYRRRL